MRPRFVVVPGGRNGLNKVVLADMPEYLLTAPPRPTTVKPEREDVEKIIEQVARRKHLDARGNDNRKKIGRISDREMQDLLRDDPGMEILVGLREHLKLSQRDMARLTGYTRGYIASAERYENRHRVRVAMHRALLEYATREQIAIPSKYLEWHENSQAA